MSQTPAAPMKVCTLCKHDVSKKPRVKDPQGRYLCEPCFARSQQKAVAAAPAPAARAPVVPKAAPVQHAMTGGEAMFDAIDNGDAGGDMLLPEGYDPALVLAAVTAKPEAPVRAHQPAISPEGVKKKDKKGKAPPPFSCRHCGYDMSGSISTRCPECGKINMQPKDQGLLDDEREVRRNTYRRPFTLMLIGWLISALVLAFGKAGVGDVIFLCAMWGVVTVFGVFTFWVCSKMFLEYDAPWHITLLRLAGIFACSTVMPTAIAIAVGFPFVFGLTSTALTILLYKTELETDWWEAVGLAVAGWVIVRATELLLAVLIMRVAAAVGGGFAPGPATPPPPPPALVSPSDPSGTVYYDDDGDGVDDDTGKPVPKDAVPLEDVPMDGGEGGGE